MTSLDFMDGTQLCAQADGEAWFPEKGQSSAAAKNICHACPLEKPCYEYALRFKLQGVWGGTSELQRKRVQREAGIEAAAVLLVEERHGDYAGVRRHTRAGEPLCETCREYSRRQPKARPPIGGVDDPRHGSVNGYKAGCRCDACSTAASGYKRGVFTHDGRRRTA